MRPLICSVFFLLTLACLPCAQAKPDPARAEQCRKKLVTAQQLGVLYNLEWGNTSEPQVWAGRTFFTIPIDAKEGFVETVNCLLTNGDSFCVNFDVLHWQTGKAVGRWSGCKLRMR